MTNEEVRDRLKKQLEDSANIAEGVRAPLKVPALVHRQAGQEILVAPCPRCHTVAALSGEGKHLCRVCHTWLEYVRES